MPFYTVAVAAAAFNLVCTGITEETAIAPRPNKAYRIEYRIDLAAKRFCADDCRKTAPMVAVTDDKLVFSRTEVDTISRRELSQDVADRLSGEHIRFILVGRGVHQYMMRWIGKCESKPFSGFPDVKHRF